MNINGIQKSVCVIGVCMALLPFLGFPGTAETLFVFIGGLSVCVLTLFSARHKQTFGEKVIESFNSVASRVFVENRPQSSE